MRQRRAKGRPIDGWLVLDKDGGMTSTDAVNALKRITNARKIGHGGTLDPLATGVLPIAFGQATKTVQYIMDAGKSYNFTVRWGEARDTDDAEGKVIATSDVRPDADAIRAALPSFVGEIAQVPPIFSAIKVDGRRAYDLARANEEFTLEARPVRIDRFELDEIVDADTAIFSVDCGKGAYIRALVRDLAEALGTCGHVAALRRTRVGSMTLDSAISLETFAGLGHISEQLKHLQPVAMALDDIPAVSLTDEEAAWLRSGRAVQVLRTTDLQHVANLSDGEHVRALIGDALVAIARIEREAEDTDTSDPSPSKAGPGMVASVTQLRPVRVMQQDQRSH